jgi:hypothetical protein
MTESWTKTQRFASGEGYSYFVSMGGKSGGHRMSHKWREVWVKTAIAYLSLKTGKHAGSRRFGRLCKLLGLI